MGLEVEARRGRQPAGAACAAAASGRSCCARTWTRCRAHAPIEPVLVDDGWENANDGILGADNKAAVAMILELARRCSVEGSPVGLELLFTVAEEVGLQGAKRFDAAQAARRVRLRVRPRDRRSARSSPPRRRCTGSRPSSTASPRTPACARRRAARRSSPPPTPPRAMPHGRIDAQTTANLGYLHGGVESTNVVPERARRARRGPLGGPRQGRGGARRR